MLGIGFLKNILNAALMNSAHDVPHVRQPQIKGNNRPGRNVQIRRKISSIFDEQVKDAVGSTVKLSRKAYGSQLTLRGGRHGFYPRRIDGKMTLTT